MNKITQAVAQKFKGTDFVCFSDPDFWHIWINFPCLELQFENYKFIFHIILTEARGQGLR
jgi:hypothetical protein